MTVKLNAFNQSSFFRTDEMRFKLDLGFAIKNILVCQSSLSQLVSNIYILFLENMCKHVSKPGKSKLSMLPVF